MPEKSLQDRIRERAAERDAEGLFANPSLEDLHEAAHGTPMNKRRKGRTSLTKSATVDAGLRAGSVRAEGSRWVGEALAGSASPSTLRKEAAAQASPAIGILGDMQRLLTAFREAEGRDPTEDDVEYWRAFAKIIKEPLGGGE